jgi:hypothetical protein
MLTVINCVEFVAYLPIAQWPMKPNSDQLILLDGKNGKLFNALGH